MAAPIPELTAGAGRQGRLLHVRTLLLVGMVTLFGALAMNAMVAHAAPVTQLDEQGPDDVSGSNAQRDLNQHTADFANAPTTIDVGWQWDETGFSGSNTGDACALFDTDNDGKVNSAVCVTIAGTPATFDSFRVWTCSDNKVDRCTSPNAQIPGLTTSCTVAPAVDPFAGVLTHQTTEGLPDSSMDTAASCTVDLAAVGTGAKLVNTCAYPSQSVNSAPDDCVLFIREGLLVIQKVATPNDPSASFNFFLDGGTTAVFTAQGSQTSDPIPVRTEITHSLTETAPSGWAQSGVATCSDGSPITAIDVASEETVTCTFNNVRQTGKLEVKKSLSPTTDPGKFDLQIDGTTDANADDVGHNGSTGEETLNTGTHTVGEVAGAGTDLDELPEVDRVPGRQRHRRRGRKRGDADNAGPLNVSVTSGSDIVCVITNTRERRQARGQEVAQPDDRPRQVRPADRRHHGHQRGRRGPQRLDRRGDLEHRDPHRRRGRRRRHRPRDYQKSIECRADNGTGAVVASAAADNAGPLNVSVTTGSDIVCVITNTRETGKLEVQKELSPTHGRRPVQP